MKQDKGSGVVIMSKPKYHEKWLELLNNDQFTKLNHDITKKIQAKIQRVLRKIKANLTSEEYSRLYPTGSFPGKFYGTELDKKKNQKITSLMYQKSLIIIPNGSLSSYQKK